MFYFIKLIRMWILYRVFARYKARKDEEYQTGRKLDWFAKFQSCWTRTCPSFLGGDDRTTEIDFSELGVIGKFKLKIKNPRTFENYVIKSFIGFLSGVIITYLCFVFLVIQLSFSFSTATILCSVFGVVLSLGLSFSTRMRCGVSMLLTEFFSWRGRQVLTAYAYILALTGPARNVVHNIGVVSESLACGKEQLKQTINDINELINKPYFAIRKLVTKFAERTHEVALRVQKINDVMNKAVYNLLEFIKLSYDWLNSVISICNKKIGTPYDRCVKVFFTSLTHAKTEGYINDSMLNTTLQVASHLCTSVKYMDYTCDIFEFVSDEVVNQVNNKSTRFTRLLRDLLYSSVDFSQSFGFDSSRAKTETDLNSGILPHFRDTTDVYLILFDWMSFGFALFFIFMLFEVTEYRTYYIESDWFNNCFINKYIRKLDMKRTCELKETVLPLRSYEKQYLASLWAPYLIKPEDDRQGHSFSLLVLAATKLFLVMICDYGLFWILISIQYHGRFQPEIEVPSSIGINTNTTTIGSQLFLVLARIFEPSGITIDDAELCLPDPSPPDFARYQLIIFLLVLIGTLALTEPYGLRIKNYIMSYYYPAEAQRRAIWLYNNIIRDRKSFCKFKRRELRLKYAKTFDGTNLKFNKRCFWKNKEACCVCEIQLNSPGVLFIRCRKKICRALYCLECFNYLEKMCTICLEPHMYDDFSDLSEEEGSTEEDVTIKDPKSRYEKANQTKDFDAEDSSGSSEYEHVCLLNTESLLLLKNKSFESENYGSYLSTKATSVDRRSPLVKNSYQDMVTENDLKDESDFEKLDYSRQDEMTTMEIRKGLKPSTFTKLQNAFKKLQNLKMVLRNTTYRIVGRTESLKIKGNENVRIETGLDTIFERSRSREIDKEPSTVLVTNECSNVVKSIDSKIQEKTPPPISEQPTTEMYHLADKFTSRTSDELPPVDIKEILPPAITRTFSTPSESSTTHTELLVFSKSLGKTFKSPSWIKHWAETGNYKFCWNKPGTSSLSLLDNNNNATESTESLSDVN